MRKLTALFATLVFLMVMVAAQVVSAAAPNVSVKGLQVSTNGGDASIWTDRSEYKVGDQVKVSFQSPVGGFAAIYDYSPDGSSKMIWPRDGQATSIQPNHTYNLPDGRYNFTATEPLGTETLVLVVSQVKSTLTFNFNLNFIFGNKGDNGNGNSRGLTTDPNGNLGLNRVEVVTNAQVSFQVVPRWQNPVIRVTGTNGARIFVDGAEVGSIPAQLTLDPGNHQLTAIMQGMYAEMKTFNLRGDGVYDWSIRLKPIR